MARRGAPQTTRPSSPSAEDRQARRRRETREKLVRAAQRVMAQKGIDATTIQEITDAADVGFGSFYNHFQSKEAIVEAIARETIEPFGAALDGIAGALDDPAEVLSASIRYTLAKAMSDAVWGRFLFFSGLEAPFDQLGLLHRAKRDLTAGVKAGRFDVSDLDCTLVVIGGAMLAVTRAWLREEIGRDAPERTAAVVLRLVGLPGKEARKIASRPLPDVALPR
jgi:AcrR family transcriptional regulator